MLAGLASPSDSRQSAALDAASKPFDAVKDGLGCSPKTPLACGSALKSLYESAIQSRNAAFEQRSDVIQREVAFHPQLAWVEQLSWGSTLVKIRRIAAIHRTDIARIRSKAYQWQ
jgi:hypothetical protein